MPDQSSIVNQLSSIPTGLPEIPGGWTTRTISVSSRPLQLTLPAVPDAFLEDPEVLAANRSDDYMPYWSYLWPAALSMAERVAGADWPRNATVLELGCGVGLVGLAARLAGLKVTMSDYDATAIQVAAHNARLNGLVDVETVTIDWREPPDAKYDVVLGCDLLYEARHHRPILDFVEDVLVDDGVCWLGDGGRQLAEEFVDRARRRGFEVALSDEAGRPSAGPRVGAFQLIELRRK